MDSKASYDGNIRAADPGMAELGIGLVPGPPDPETGPAVFVWCAANIGILGVVYGAVIVSFGLSFWQAILAAVAGVASFALVGITSIAGKIGRTTTLTLSRVILANAVISPHQLLLGEFDGLGSGQYHYRHAHPRRAVCRHGF